MINEVKENEILWARVNEDVIIPTKRDEDACYDIYAYFDEDYKIIYPNETKIIHTGLYVALNKKYKLELCERGSTGTKGMGQRAGEIDSGYRGEIGVPITNHNNGMLIISKFIKEDGKVDEETTNNVVFKGKTRHNASPYGVVPYGTVYYPYTKAITSGAIVEVPQMESKEISIEELKAIPSARGEGSLGSSGK